MDFILCLKEAEFQYKVTDYYYPQYERTLKWNDKDAAIMWPFYEWWGYPQPKLSAKDEMRIIV